MMENIALIGSSGHAKVIIDIVEKQGVYRIVGLIDTFRAVGEETLGYRVIGAEFDLPRLAQEHDLKGCVVAIGDNNARSKVVSKIVVFAQTSNS
jgi:FlaA1/EpsC-like NDP-sugar epimerase